MSKLRFILSASLVVLSLVSGAPCLAEDSDGVVKKVLAVPVRSVGCVTGIMLGTPIAITRMSLKRFHEHLTGDEDMSGKPNMADAFAAIPMGIGEGICMGIFYGPKNAITNFDKPFSKESMSLAEVSGN